MDSRLIHSLAVALSSLIFLTTLFAQQEFNRDMSINVITVFAKQYASQGEMRARNWRLLHLPTCSLLSQTAGSLESLLLAISLALETI